jgi:uncharacterized protein
MSRIVKSLGSSMRKIPSIFFRDLVCAVLVCLGLAAVSSAARAEQIKTIHPTGYVTDLAGVIDAGTRARLEALCAELQQKTGAQMAIVTVHSLEGETAPQFANELFKQLGVGSKKEDRGVLLLVAPDEHKYWTEVGYGLEPVINDARAGDAGRAMVPLLRQGNYSAAIESAAWQLAKYIADDRGVTLSGQPPVRQVRNTGDRGGGLGFGIAFLVGFLILASIISRFSGRGGGGGGSGIGWLIASMLLSGGGGRSGGGSWGGGGFGGGSGGGGFGGFGGGSSGGGGAGGSW